MSRKILWSSGLILFILLIISLIVVAYTTKENTIEVKREKKRTVNFSYFDSETIWTEEQPAEYVYEGEDLSVSKGCCIYTFESFVPLRAPLPNLKNLYNDFVINDCHKISQYNKNCLDADQIGAKYVTKNCDRGEESLSPYCITEENVFVKNGTGVSYTKRCVNKDCEGDIGVFSFNFGVDTQTVKNQEGFETEEIISLKGTTRCISVDKIKLPKEFKNSDEENIKFLKNLGVAEFDLEDDTNSYPVTFKNVICDPYDPRQKFKTLKYSEPFSPTYDREGLYGKIIFRALDSYLDMDFGTSGGITSIGLCEKGNGYFTDSYYSLEGTCATCFVSKIGGDGVSGPVESVRITNPGENYKVGELLKIINPDTPEKSVVEVKSVASENATFVFRKTTKDQKEGIKWMFMPKLNMLRSPITGVAREDLIQLYTDINVSEYPYFCKIKDKLEICLFPNPIGLNEEFKTIIYPKTRYKFKPFINMNVEFLQAEPDFVRDIRRGPIDINPEGEEGGGLTQFVSYMKNIKDLLINRTMTINNDFFLKAISIKKISGSPRGIINSDSSTYEVDVLNFRYFFGYKAYHRTIVAKFSERNSDVFRGKFFDDGVVVWQVIYRYESIFSFPNSYFQISQESVREISSVINTRSGGQLPSVSIDGIVTEIGDFNITSNDVFTREQVDYLITENFERTITTNSSGSDLKVDISFFESSETEGKVLFYAVILENGKNYTESQVSEPFDITFTVSGVEITIVCELTIKKVTKQRFYFKRSDNNDFFSFSSSVNIDTDVLNLIPYSLENIEIINSGSGLEEKVYQVDQFLDRRFLNIIKSNINVTIVSVTSGIYNTDDEAPKSLYNTNIVPDDIEIVPPDFKVGFETDNDGNIVTKPDENGIKKPVLKNTEGQYLFSPQQIVYAGEPGFLDKFQTNLFIQQEVVAKDESLEDQILNIFLTWDNRTGEFPSTNLLSLKSLQYESQNYSEATQPLIVEDPLILGKFIPYEKIKVEDKSSSKIMTNKNFAQFIPYGTNLSNINRKIPNF